MYLVQNCIENNCMTEKLNIEAFQLVNLVSEKPLDKSAAKSELFGSMKEKGVSDFAGEFIGDIIEDQIDYLNETIEKFVRQKDENVSLGFFKSEYLIFKEFISKLYSIDKINNVFSKSSLEREVFKWIISTYKHKKAEASLSDFLLNIIDDKVKPHIFYFPILNLEIEVPFTIGNVEITYFQKDYLDNLYLSLKSNNKSLTSEEFDNIYRKDFQGQVLAKVTINAERKKAEEIAKRNAEIAVDVLKLYSDTAYLAEKKSMFDINYRIGYQVKTMFLSHNTNEVDNLPISCQFNNYPFKFGEKHLELALNSGLRIFSKYISKPLNDELYNIIIQSIGLFSSSISNWDLHLRCVNLITILESVFLRDEEEHKMSNKVKSRFSQIATKNNLEREKIRTVISNIYEVRHKMIHKARRLPINTKDLSFAQVAIIQVFLNLIHYNAFLKVSNKKALIEILENQIKK